MSRKNNKKGLALFIVLIILTILSIATAVIATVEWKPMGSWANGQQQSEGSNGYYVVNSQGITWGWNPSSSNYQVPTIGKLAYDVRENKNKFLAIENPAEFVGRRYVSAGYGGLDVVQYSTGVCLYHQQAIGNETSYIVTNVLDINIGNNSGIAIYGYPNGSNGNTITDSVAAYRIAKGLYEASQGNTITETSQNGPYHNTLKLVYKNFILNPYSSYINTSFWNDQNAISDLNAEWNGDNNLIETLRNVQSIESNHTLTYSESNGEGTANIIYDNDNSYIGPLKITYDGDITGKTFTLNSLTVNDETASLVKKEFDGSYKEVQLNNVQSGCGTYYVKVSGKILTKATIKMTIASNATTYKARILLCKTPIGESNSQNAMIFAVEKGTGNTSNSSGEGVTVERKTTKVSLQKKDSSGNNINVSGIEFAIYNSNNKLVKKVKTDENGKTATIDLAAGTYKVKEVSVANSMTYGYKGGIIKNNSNETTFTVSEEDITKVTVTKNIKNTPQYGDIRIEKRAEYDQTVKLVGAEFKIKNESGYIKLLDTNGKFVQSATGLVTISKTGKAQIVEDKTQYVVQYVQNKTEATTFITNSNGNIKIENLEVYSGVGTKYNYTAIETSTGAANDYFDILTNIAPVELTAGSTTYISNDKETNALKEPLKYIDLSGYVWLDIPQGKSSTRDGLYVDGQDQRLNGITVNLKYGDDTVQTTVTSGNGEYKFTKVEISQLSKCYVEFEYDGLIYTSVLANKDADNGSKASEIYGNIDTEKTRAYINSKYTNITGESVLEDNTIKAETRNILNTNNSYETLDLSNLYKSGKELTNINLGLQSREQPDLAISNDVQNVILTLNGYQYTYRYAQVQSAEDAAKAQKVEFNISAKFRYSRNIYASDIQAAKENRAKLEAYVTYGITVTNQSSSVGTIVRQINDYYDVGVESVEGIGTVLNDDGTISNNERLTSYDTEVQKVQQGFADGDREINAYFERYEMKLKLNSISNDVKGIKLNPGESVTIYIKYKLLDDTVLGLLNQDRGIYNVATIASYQSFYGKDTYEGSRPQSGVNEGNIYAGLDEDSIPNNETIRFMTDENGNKILYDKSGTVSDEGTPEIDRTALLKTPTNKFGEGHYEDDAATAPTLVLQATHERAISGTVFEDTNASPEENVRLGNGTLEDNEKRVKDVKVELLDVSDPSNITLAKYSNGKDVVVFTGDNGEYTLGYSNPEEGYVGILPGEYVIMFTYTDGTSKIMTADGERDVSVLVYKSTIISDKIKEIWDSTNTKWYVQDNVKNGSYSVAVDDYTIVENLNKITINNETINNLADTYMCANTPTISVGIEFETTDAMTVVTYEDGELVGYIFVENFKNMNFGIIEKPHASVETTKTVTSIEYTNAKGETLFVGNPTNNDKIQYVKYANVDKNNRFVEGEIDTDLIQGSTLKVTYAMSIKNTSEVDYTTQEYYYFGTNNQKAEQAKLNITKVVDYLDSDIVFDKDTSGTAWNVINLDNESEKEKFEKLIDEGEGKVNTTGYQILISEEYREIARGDTKTTNSYASVVTETSVDNIDFYNCIEILEYTGGKRILDTTPGNYNPNNPEKLETDSAMIKITINPTTGKDINYAPYIITGIITLIIVATGIVIIKKRLLK